jgi:hypothetical protein
MKNTILSIAAVFSMAGAAVAQDATAPALSGEVSLDFVETTAGNVAGSMGLELGIDAQGLGAVNLDFEAVDGGAVTLENWTVSTTIGAVGLAFGDDNGLMPGAEGEHTLAEPAMAESVMLSYGDAAVAVGFTDWTTDMGDISNVQGAYTFALGTASVTTSADYNFDSENTVVGAELSGIEVASLVLGGAATYDVDAEVFGFEGIVTTGGLVAYVNGTDDDALQNIGGEYTHVVGGATLTAGANYNVDTEDFAPTAGISFAF